MQTVKTTNHQCQIDCTNHDEVINALQLKSKDLYYFWRNYQWLYNKYYSQQKSVPKQVVVTNNQAEEEKERVIAENRKLRMQIELLKKQVQGLSANTNNRRVEQEYQRQITRLKTKCDEYEKIREKQIQQISNLTNALRTKDDTIADIQSKCRRQLKKQQQRIVDLQTTIDSLRAKLMNNTGNISEESITEIKQAIRRETTRTQTIINRLEERCVEVLENDLESTRRELIDLFPQIMYRFSNGDLSLLITQQQEST